MKTTNTVLLALGLVIGLGAHHEANAKPSAKKILGNVLKSDVWGLPGSEVEALAIVKRGRKTRKIEFEAQSTRYDGKLTKRVIRLSAPAEVSGTNFLQIELAKKDDKRYLYVPELKRARRITGANRSKPFMGTDFSYADLDRRELRNADVTLEGTKKLGKYKTWHLELTPRGDDAQYDRIEMFVRQDNFISLRTKMYKDGEHVKTLEARELRKINDRWYITRSLLQDHTKDSKTELRLENIKEKDDFAKGTFTVAALEK
jgi:hypothetical protein